MQQESRTVRFKELANHPGAKHAAKTGAEKEAACGFTGNR